MIVDFSRINTREPLLILSTKTDDPIGVLKYAHNIVVEINYNEMSRLTFNLPAYVDGEKTPHYDDVIGMKIINLRDVGKFIIMNPSTSGDGISETKAVNAYSLEYEWTYKQIFLENSTYNFWNPVARSGTILGILMEMMPNWSVGTVSADLVGRHRTFDVQNENIYNFIKSTVQQTYQCVFEFDTINRVVNVRSVHSAVYTQPVYLSLDNLIKNVEVEEDTQNIITSLDVNGADGVNIRSVNPMGINKIYDLSYFMNTTNFTQHIIDKYHSWQDTFESFQLPYYNLSVETTLRTTEWLTENARLTELQGQLKNLENQQAVIIQAIHQRLQTQSALDAINAQINSMNATISTQRNLLTSINSQIRVLNAEMISINNATALSAFFTPDELLMLDRYIKEDSITESNFVAPAVKNFNSAGMSNVITNSLYSITGANITRVLNTADREIFDISGGVLSVTTGIQINAEIVRATYMVGADRNFLFTAIFRSGSVGGESFPSGCISLTGTISGTTSSDVAPDPILPQIFRGTRVSFTVSTARFFFTRNTTIYEQRSVEWDLYEYGRDVLRRLSRPAYTFDVGMADFLSLDEFAAFKDSVSLGDRVYLRLSDDMIIEPIAIRCSIDYDNQQNFRLEFGNTFRVTDHEFELLDLLNQSISMGRRVDFKQFNYNAWVESGAQTSVGQFINSALDVAVNAILSSRGQAPTLDETGLRIRKRLYDGTYDPRQMWAVSNSLMFTSNNWQTAELAIGEFVDDNAGHCWGIVGRMIVGTILAGNNLIIESERQDGGRSVFRVDGNGAALYNATFDLFNGSNTQITLNPFTGFAIGRFPLYSGDNYTINTNNARFWVDMNGNVHLRGTLHGVDGTFSGELSAATGNFHGVVRASDFQDPFGRSMLRNPNNDYRFTGDYIDARGIIVRNWANQITFQVDSNGNVFVSGSIHMGAGSTITWGAGGANAPTAAQVGARPDWWNV